MFDDFDLGMQCEEFYDDAEYYESIMNEDEDNKEFYIVAIPGINEINFDWIASFEDEEAASSYAIKIPNAIIVHNVVKY